MVEEKLTKEQIDLMILKDKVELKIERKERANSKEFGKAGNRFKLYFEDADDLVEQINKLKEKGLYKDED